MGTPVTHTTSTTSTRPTTPTDLSTKQHTMITDDAPLTMTTPFAAAGWARDARCRTEEVPAGLFFSEDLGEIATAKRICAVCPVMAECLEQAIHNQEPWGVWGGQLFLNGRMLAVKRRRGRPPKHPRPEDQLPVIPIPEHLLPLVRTA